MTRGQDIVFHQAAIRITQCAEEPRLALEVLVDGTFTVLEAAVEHKVDKLIAASSASVYGLAEQFPTGERHHHHNNDTFYGAAKSFNEGMVRSFRAMYGLDYVLLRYFNVYGPRMDVHGLYTEVLVRWMERIADGQPPLIFGDGLQTMDFVVHRRHRAREPARGEQRRGRRRLQHRDAAPRRACSGWPRRCCARWTPTCRSSTARSVRSTASRGGWPTRAAARIDLGFEAEIGLEDGLRALVEWWRPLRSEIAAGRALSPRGGAPHEPHQRDAAVVRARGDRRGQRGHRLRLGGPGPARSRRSRRRSPQAMQVEHAVAASSCTTALHLALVVAGVGPATTSSSRRSRSSPRRTRRRTSARARCSPTSTR